MARYIGPSCRLCRREGCKLYLKGEKCSGKSCPVDKRNYAPGQHGSAKKKLSEYGVQLREKQKAKRIYGILETQFRNYFKKADKMSGITGENLLVLIEKRLDNVVYRLGFGRSRVEARQVVRHNHIKVNGKKVNIPSYIVKVGDVIEVKREDEPIQRFKDITEATSSRIVPEWLSSDKENYKGTVLNEPQRSLIDSPINETLIVELYSK